MAHTADAIIIGAGVIGAATAFELAKLGWTTISVDRNTQAGHGSTSGSCAIIRMHYSTLDGTAFAYEGYHYWRDWPIYLEEASAGEPIWRSFARLGCLVMKTEANGHLEKHIANSRALNCPFEEWDGDRNPGARACRSTISEIRPGAKRPEADGFGEPTGGGAGRRRFSGRTAATSPTRPSRPRTSPKRRNGARAPRSAWARRWSRS